MQLKYKLFDKENNEFIQGNNVPFVTSLGEIYAGGLNVSDRYIICVSTGLKDKNGTEIYKGNVVEVYGYYRGNYNVYADDYHYTLTGVVDFMPSKGFYLKIFKRWNTDEDIEIISKNKVGYITQSSSLVIGNIHQNPELINQ